MLFYVDIFFCRGMEDESGDQFVAYFLPTDETLEKRKTEAAEQIEQTQSVGDEE